MFGKMFEKYARVVPEGRRRAELYGKYVFKVVSYLLTAAASIALIVELVIAGLEEEPTNAVLAVVTATMFVWWAFAATALVGFVRFRTAYNRALAAPCEEGEPEEYSAYRMKLRQERRAELKATGWALILAAAGFIAMVALTIADFSLNPESEDLGLFSYLGIGAFAVGLAVYLVTVISYNNKKAASGDNPVAVAAAEQQAIDAREGRADGYSLKTDTNLASFDYLFPTEEKRLKIKSLREKQVKAVTAALIVSVVAALVVAVMFFSDVFGRDLSGYAVPVSIAMISASVMAASLPFGVKINAVEREQKILLESTPEYELNLAVYRKYESFSKFKGKTLIFASVVALASGFALAALFPDKLWSFASVLAIIVGLLLNNRFVKTLRKEVIPLEREIDEKKSESKTL